MTASKDPLDEGVDEPGQSSEGDQAEPSSFKGFMVWLKLKSEADIAVYILLTTPRA